MCANGQDELDPGWQGGGMSRQEPSDGITKVWPMILSLTQRVYEYQHAWTRELAYAAQAAQWLYDASLPCHVRRRDTLLQR
jgi:hypothetical protein